MDTRAFEAMLDAVGEAVVAVDAELRVRHLNRPAEHRLGVGRADAAGRELAELVPGEYGGGVPRPSAGWRAEPLPDGWVLFGAGPPSGEEAGCLPAQLVEAEQLAAVGQLAAGVAHEIGAPLTAISVAVEYLLRSRAAREAGLGPDLEMILSQTQRLARLARSLVDLARPGDPVLAAVDLNRVVGDAFALMDRQLRRDAVEGVLELDPELPPTRGDANQLQQVLINLLLNAQRAVLAPGAQRRRIEVRTRSAGDANELVVRDWGPGIDPDDLPRIFLPFFSRAGGPGLGLSLSRNLVHRHGGSIRAEGSAGSGATFRVRLPRGDRERAS